MGYEVPEARVEAYDPKGFRISIPDVEGLRLFVIRGKINEEVNGREIKGLHFGRFIQAAKDGRWTYINLTATLKPGDKIYFYFYVKYFDGQNTLRYHKDDQVFEVKELIGKPNETTQLNMYSTDSIDYSTGKHEGDCQPTPTAVFE